MRVLVVIVVAGAVLVALALLAVLGWMVLRPARARSLVEGLFRRPAPVGKPLPPDHYYRTYWGGKSAA